MRTTLAAALVVSVAVSACGPRTLQLPEGPGQPFPGFKEAFAAASARCRDVSTLTAEASVSGTVGGGKVRGRVIVGFERPGRIRLEGVAPIGAPVFILVSDAGRATLLMPRAREVLTDQPPQLVLEALVGVSLNPDVLLAALAGCVSPDPQPTSGSRYSEGWARVELDGGATAFLREVDGRWRILAGNRPLVALEYEYASGDAMPRAVRLRAARDGGSGANLKLQLAQVEVNAPIASKAFTVDVPSGTVPITLADLKQSGPLGERR